MGTRAPLPLHLRPGSIALVFAGGAVGTAGRELLQLAVPKLAGVPVATMGINISGAFLLGLLLSALAARGPDAGARRAARLLLGTGVLGGFTTYSSLAVDTAGLLASGRIGAAGWYAFGTVLAGALATLVGIVLGSSFGRRSAA